MRYDDEYHDESRGFTERPVGGGARAIAGFIVALALVVAVALVVAAALAAMATLPCHH